MTTILSIIIPCFNSERTLESTLESVINQDFQDWEAIIVNDGSTDGTEEIAMGWVHKDKRFKYYSKNNEGLGKTRNFAIEKANGIYILPLDSDNQVEKDFAKDAIEVFENNQDIGVVHGHAEYFGEHGGFWEVDDYDLEKILMFNYIDACAIYKKILWKTVGGYDTTMPYQGNEDWEFWLAFGLINVKFYHLKKITFKYYVSKISMIRSFTIEMQKLNEEYVVKKYRTEYFRYFCKNFLMVKNLELSVKKNASLAYEWELSAQNSASLAREWELLAQNSASLAREWELLAKKTENDYSEKLKSKKFVFFHFLKTFFGFLIFKKLQNSQIK